MNRSEPAKREGRLRTQRGNLAVAIVGTLLGLSACATRSEPAPVILATEPIAEPSPSPAPEMPANAVADLARAPEAASPAALAASRETFATWLAAFRRTSCPAGVQFTQPAKIPLTASPVTLDRLGAGRSSVGSLDFVAGFHLSSSDARFGGVSGLAVRNDGGLLAISDTGAFIWIDLGKDSATPTAARFSPMKDAVGKTFGAKGEADAEGLALLDGLALVSFEQDHRVMAFDVATCGAAARAAAIPGMDGAIQAAFNRRSIVASGNTGVEALAVSRDGILFEGVEKLAGGASPLSARAMERSPRFDLAAGPGSPQLSGMDLLQEAGGDAVTLYTLHRTPAMFGEAIAIWEAAFSREMETAGPPAKQVGEMTERAAIRYRKTGERKLAGLSALPFNIDNFEGIAARRMPDGKVRLYVISDDNFASGQRTLLMVFEVR